MHLLKRDDGADRVRNGVLHAETDGQPNGGCDSPDTILGRHFFPRVLGEGIPALGFDDRLNVNSQSRKACRNTRTSR
jgi:hypothetical protein